ncbi:unnamed protein product [Eruca vesicaria subsp. sativa]|uniref:Uncharacterized protein n=1 Tax=Eruca vesicaria subsp. sativa TaxID=29727 RepID=A0ABC8KKP8_ERUVS|nr:unnamed protein product [Eruca vesicaria subsp. sativa]
MSTATFCNCFSPDLSSYPPPPFASTSFKVRSVSLSGKADYSGVLCVVSCLSPASPPRHSSSAVLVHRCISPNRFAGTLTDVTTGSIVQECWSARFTHDYLTALCLSHYAVSSINGSSKDRFCGFLGLFVADLTVQEGELARFTSYIIIASPSQYDVSSINGLSQCQLCHLQTGVVSNQPESFYLLSDVCSDTFCLNEYDDNMLRFLVTNYSTRYGNIEFRGLNLFQPSAMSSNFILSVSLETKLELEIHLVSLVSLVGFKAVYVSFSVISSQIGLRSLNVAYGSRASHLRFSTVNISTASYRCFNVVFDYQLFFRTIAMGTKVKFPFGFLHFAEHVLPMSRPEMILSILIL